MISFVQRLAIGVAVTALAAAPALSATSHDRRIPTVHSPSGKVRCTINAQRVVCATTAKPKMAVRILAGKRAQHRPFLAIAAGSVLPYGQTTTVARFSCSSSAAGIRCRDRTTKHGFLISRLAVKLQPTPVKPKPKPKAPVVKKPTRTSAPNLGTCAAVKRAGLGPYRRGVHPQYAYYRDADGDGIVCE